MTQAGEIILILGGARAGKSAFALKLAGAGETKPDGEVCFIATAEALDEEMAARIRRHRAERSADWQTIEEPREIDRALSQARYADVVIVDCLTLFVSNCLLADQSERSELDTTRIVESFLDLAKQRRQTVICVSNEVGMGLVPEFAVGREFRDLLGRVNQRFARAADRVYLLVAGLPLQLKGSETNDEEHRTATPNR